MYYLPFIMSSKKRVLEEKTEVWRQRLPVWVMDGLREGAKRDRRRLTDYISIQLEDLIRGQSPSFAPHPSTVGTSQPPSRIAKVPVKTLPKTVEQEVMESDEGWEGSDPRTLLANTRTKP